MTSRACTAAITSHSDHVTDHARARRTAALVHLVELSAAARAITAEPLAPPVLATPSPRPGEAAARTVCATAAAAAKVSAPLRGSHVALALARRQGALLQTRP